MLARAAFAAEIAARNLAGSEHLFLIVDSEGDEIDAFFRLLEAHNRGLWEGAQQKQLAELRQLVLDSESLIEKR
jgi:hypothetical protein